MLFNTAEYILFFLIAVFIYFIIPGKLRGLWLLVSSCWFYANWNRTYLLLLLFTAAVSYLTGAFLAKMKDAGRRRAVLTAGILLQLLLLIYFKYTMFLLQAGGHLLRVFHASVPQEGFAFASGILLPVGISFFTFKVSTTSSAGGLRWPLQGPFVIPPKGGSNKPFFMLLVAA